MCFWALSTSFVARFWHIAPCWKTGQTKLYSSWRKKETSQCHCGCHLSVFKSSELSSCTTAKKVPSMPHTLSAIQSTHSHRGSEGSRCPSDIHHGRAIPVKRAETSHCSSLCGHKAWSASKETSWSKEKEARKILKSPLLIDSQDCTFMAIPDGDIFNHQKIWWSLSRAYIRSCAVWAAHVEWVRQFWQLATAALHGKTHSYWSKSTPMYLKITNPL